jgi:hypothetical protein
MTRLFTPAERRAHLRSLIDALTDLIAALDHHDRFPAQRAGYADLQARALDLENQGFEQSDLNQLARATPALFHLHRDWNPPYEPTGTDGILQLAPWFIELDAAERRVTSATRLLRSVGEW